MIHIERNRNGSYTVSAEVRDNGETPFSWYERHTFYDYPKAELKKLYKQHLAEKGLKIQK
jgi:hypothetical protein